jgi:hypothetical protein
MTWWPFTHFQSSLQCVLFSLVKDVLVTDVLENGVQTLSNFILVLQIVPPHVKASPLLNFVYFTTQSFIALINSFFHLMISQFYPSIYLWGTYKRSF